MVHQQPVPRWPLPPCSDDESVGRGSSLFHHPNCRVVCVHQGNSRDFKLNSNMQFIQDVRPVERLCRLPCSPARRLPACRSPPWSPGTKVLRKGILPGLLASCIPILQMGLLRHREGSCAWKPSWGHGGQRRHGLICLQELCVTKYLSGTP